MRLQKAVGKIIPLKGFIQATSKAMKGRSMDDPLKEISPQSTLPQVRKIISTLLQEFQSGDGKAGFMLGLLYDPDNLLLSDKVKEELGVSREQAIEYYSNAYNILTKQATEGHGPAMHLMAYYFQTGTPPVTIDMDKYDYWIKKCLEAGYRGGGQL